MAIGQLPPVDGRTPRERRMRTSINAPEASRMAVKLAASMVVSRRATRQSSELPAKASIANVVTRTMRRLVPSETNADTGFARHLGQISERVVGQHEAVAAIPLFVPGL